MMIVPRSAESRTPERVSDMLDHVRVAQAVWMNLGGGAEGQHDLAPRDPAAHNIGYP